MPVAIASTNDHSSLTQRHSLDTRSQTYALTHTGSLPPMGDQSLAPPCSLFATTQRQIDAPSTDRAPPPQHSTEIQADDNPADTAVLVADSPSRAIRFSQEKASTKDAFISHLFAAPPYKRGQIFPDPWLHPHRQDVHECLLHILLPPMRLPFEIHEAD